MDQETAVLLLTKAPAQWRNFCAGMLEHGTEIRVITPKLDSITEHNSSSSPICVIDGDSLKLEEVEAALKVLKASRILIHSVTPQLDTWAQFCSAQVETSCVFETDSGEATQQFRSRIFSLTQTIAPALGPQEMGMLERFAKLRVDVLLTGESGVGKEVVAQYLHKRLSAHHPFIAVNCAALPDDLLESELFGVAKGAFTGAQHARAGKFEAAGEGTLFLDEIGDLPLSQQAKLLRVLQERSCCRLGEHRARKINARLVFATNRDLRTMVDEGTFRKDLYHRLSVFPLAVRPLRDRVGRISELVQIFIEQINRQYGTTLNGVSQSSLQCLQSFSWPGNIRQLRNTMMRLAVLHQGSGTIQLEELPAEIRQQGPAPTTSSRIEIPEDGLDLQQILSDVELQLTMQALERTDGNKTKAAQLLGVKRTTLVEKLKRTQNEVSMFPCTTSTTVLPQFS